MEWYQAISYLLTNEIRLIVGLCMIIKLMDVVLDRNAIGLTILGGCIITALDVAALPAISVTAVEISVLVLITGYYMPEQLRLCFFLIFFYEVAVALWEFLISAGLSLLFHSVSFMDRKAMEYLVSVWVLHLLMVAVAVLLVKWKNDGNGKVVHLVSVVVILGVLGVIGLSQQTIIPFNDNQLVTWIILSMVLMFAVFIYRMKHQHEMEEEIAQLKQEQADILELDYQTLRKTYAANAKLYHDLHNHIETIYQCLIQGEVKEATKYCEDLCTPVREISTTIWTGDKAIDYLIGSKVALAKQEYIQTKVNVEFPHHTNIKSVDLITVLGNLLDNALEAVESAVDNLRFINLTIRRINDMLIIKVENGCGEKPVLNNGEWKTLKGDKTLHGWGIKSVLAVAERYDGTLETDYENGVFQSVVILSYCPIKSE